MPAPNLSTEYIREKELDERRTYIYSINYHTAYVMGILISVLLNKQKIRIRTDEVKLKPTISTILELSSSTYIKQWQEIAKDLSFENESFLNNWNAMVGLYRNVDSNEYKKVEMLLDCNSEYGEHEILKQAAELLQRLSHPV